MAAVNPPDYIQASSHGADAFRRALKALRALAGVAGTADMAVSQNGTPNMSVNVAAGQAIIDGTENAVTQGSYIVLNDAVVNLAVAASDPTNPRNDLVVAKVQDAFYSGGTNAWSLAVVTGTPAGSPVDPAAPSNSITLARVRVDALATTIVNAKITDLRVQGPMVDLSTNPALSPSLAGSSGASLRASRLDHVHQGGTLGFVEVSATQGTFSALTDLTSLTLTVTPVLNRRYRISCQIPLSSTVATDILAIAIREGATVLQGAQVTATTTGGFVTLTCSRILVGDGSAHTYKLSAERSNGTGVVTMQAGATQVGVTYYAHLLIEDIGT